MAYFLLSFALGFFAAALVLTVAQDIARGRNRRDDEV